MNPLYAHILLPTDGSSLPTGVGGLFLGSETQRVLARIPVLVIR